ncbi:Serine/threonine-protein kinase Nek8 [Symbiodinium microadriaticum]|uniref:non-specific serine/threonine protein kinase n=1 Tax=Symbiodinium microadriaticum TaxID=2951 RepID=A0A1Q9CIM1_SYMMI|nr:Serine/threonine-protein kinase Nek8 [Symbiodinium microadriaticum]
MLQRSESTMPFQSLQEGIVKLGDFGISRVLDSSTAGAQTTIGTPHYLSPEMVNNEAYGTRSDLWSLGVVTYELAALRVPFAGSSLPAVAMKIMGADPDPLPERYSQVPVRAPLLKGNYRSQPST